MKEHLLSVRKDCTSSNTEMNKARALPQVINILEEKKDFSTPSSKTTTCLNTVGLSDSVPLVLS